MKVSSFINLKKKYKANAFRWHVVELYRLGLVSEAQILAELKISATAARPKFPSRLESSLSALSITSLLSQTQLCKAEIPQTADEKEN
jgi:hypothetical protein